MNISTTALWKSFSSDLFFFILKRVKNKDATNDILQNVFLKAHKALPGLNDQGRAKAWLFQIARNEIANYFEAEGRLMEDLSFRGSPTQISEDDEAVCCFEKVIQQLPHKYREVITMIYFEGKKQQEVADLLELSLANVKARIRRGKEKIIQDLSACCKFELDHNGRLKGEANCHICGF